MDAPKQEPSLVDEYDKLNRNAHGQLYRPTMRYRVVFTAPNAPEVRHSTGCIRQADAIQQAQEWVAHEKGRSAEIYRRRDPKCRRLMHYWNDGQIQYIRCA